MERDSADPPASIPELMRQFDDLYVEWRYPSLLRPRDSRHLTHAEEIDLIALAYILRRRLAGDPESDSVKRPEDVYDRA